MPKAYTTKDLHDTYGRIALKRTHQCDECGTRERISHSHLAPKAHFGTLATLEENIVYHCMSMGNIVGCHDQYEGMDVAKMKNFEKYFRFLHGHNAETRKYFWLRMFKLEEHWLRHDMKVWRRIRSLMAEMNHIEHPMMKHNGHAH